jgi:hypothetical protein
VKLLILSNLGQWTACVLLGAGLASMFLSSWAFADTIVTIGAVVFSASTKVKLISYEIEAARSGRIKGK